MQVAVLGATGTVGARTQAALVAAGAQPSVVERGRTDDGGSAVPLLVAAGANEEVRAAILAAAAAGRDVVDVDRDAGHVAWLYDEVAILARERGGRVVAGAGLRWAIGDLLAAVAATDLGPVTEVHVAYHTGGLRDAVTAGERRARLTGLGAAARIRVDGRLVEEPIGAARRLAWFPRPVGPSHAAGVAGGEAITVPLHRPEVRTVRTYEAMPGWRAEWLQAEANLAGTGWGHRLLTRRAARPRPAPGAAALAARRFGCVVEVTDGRDLGRAWAYGHDPVRLTAEIAALLATSLGRSSGSSGPRPGAVAASQVAPAGDLLDHLGVRTDLRWSRSRVELAER